MLIPIVRCPFRYSLSPILQFSKCEDTGVCNSRSITHHTKQRQQRLKYNTGANFFGAHVFCPDVARCAWHCIAVHTSFVRITRISCRIAASAFSACSFTSHLLTVIFRESTSVAIANIVTNIRDIIGNTSAIVCGTRSESNGGVIRRRVLVRVRVHRRYPPACISSAAAKSSFRTSGSVYNLRFILGDSCAFLLLILSGANSAQVCLCIRCRLRTTVLRCTGILPQPLCISSDTTGGRCLGYRVNGGVIGINTAPGYRRTGLFCTGMLTRSLGALCGAVFDCTQRFSLNEINVHITFKCTSLYSHLVILAPRENDARHTQYRLSISHRL